MRHIRCVPSNKVVRGPQPLRQAQLIRFGALLLILIFGDLGEALVNSLWFWNAEHT